MKTPSEILTEAADLLSESTWIQGRLAATPAGRSVSPTSDLAGQFCMTGAICRAANAEGYSPKYLPQFNKIDEALRKVTGYGEPTFWNDRPVRIKDEVVSALRSAAQVIEEEREYMVLKRSTMQPDAWYGKVAKAQNEEQAIRKAWKLSVKRGTEFSVLPMPIKVLKVEQETITTLIEQ